MSLSGETAQWQLPVSTCRGTGLSHPMQAGNCAVAPLLLAQSRTCVGLVELGSRHLVKEWPKPRGEETAPSGGQRDLVMLFNYLVWDPPGGSLFGHSPEHSAALAVPAGSTEICCYPERHGGSNQGSSYQLLSTK